jgi:hypothetical protein
MDAKTLAASPCDDGVELLLSASKSAAYYRAAAARAKALQAITTTSRVKRYLDGIITMFEGRAVDIENSRKAGRGSVSVTTKST